MRLPALPGTQPASAWLRQHHTALCLAGTSGSTVLLLLGGDDLPWGVAIALVVVATSCCAALVRRPDLELRGLLIAIGGVTLVAVAQAPIGSHDVWSYVLYGRMLGVHGASPYLHTPAQYPHDPFLHLVGWRHTPSMYGPMFNLFAATGAILAGHSALIARLWHQLAAAGALSMLLALVWRRTRDPRAVAWIGLHPLILVSVVNGGHNDLLVGLLLACTVLALADGHPGRAGAFAGLAALVKATAALGCIGAIAWACSRRDRSTGLRVAAGVAAVAVLGLIPFGLGPIRVLGDHANLMSRASVWQFGRDALDAVSAGGLHDIRFLGGVAVLALAVLVVRWRRGDADAAGSVGGAAAAYQAAGPYVLPWYASWSLAALAFRRDSPLARWAWWYGVLILALYELPRHEQVISRDFEHAIVGTVLPLLALGTFLVAARLRSGAGTEPEVALGGAGGVTMGVPRLEPRG